MSPRTKQLVEGAKKAGKGGLVMLLVGFFGGIFVVFLALLGLRKGHAVRSVRKKRTERKKRH